MSAEEVEKQIARWNALSDGLFGEADEIDIAEAEELLKAAGVDPARLEENLYRRMLAHREEHLRDGKPVPELLEQAIRDLQPGAGPHDDESHLLRTVRLHVKRLLTQIRNLPELLETGMTPAFTAAYRNRSELSARDKKTLDKMAAELRKKTRA